MYRFVSLLSLLLFLGCTHYETQLPILSYTINSNGNKTFYTISYDDDKFYNQSGTVFTTENLKNKVVIANFFFTRCPSICPPMRHKLIGIAETFSEASDFMILSHTIDPKNDTTEVLKVYADQTEIPSTTWQFISATENETKAIAKQYMTNFKPNEDDTDFYHSSYVALIDKQQQIRGFYNLLVDEEIERLEKDLELLLK